MQPSGWAEHLTWCAAQAMLACVGVFVLQFVILVPLNPLGMAENVAAYSVAVIGGAGFAVLVSKYLPDSTKSGRWSWIVPAPFLISAIISEREEIHDIFFGQGEGGWVLIFLTIPTFGCCCYSAVMALRHKRPSPVSLPLPTH